jgi:serine/threonine-protein phosphatase PGAM5
MASRFLYLMRHGEAAEDGELTARGEEQARLAGERLRSVPLTGILHSPQPRAVRTAQIVASRVPGVSPAASELLDDYIPSDPDLTELPASFGRLVSAYSPAERMAGARLARSAVERFGGAGASAGSGADEHELLVTHNFLIGWFVRDVLGAPDWRWLGLNQQNCALTVLLYRAERPPSLLSFNDASHLTAALRWTGIPPGLRPPSG